MDKLELHKRFIELRAAGFSYDQICNKIKITKPTAISWGKKFSSQIDETQNYLLVKTFGQEIKKQNDTFTLYFEQFRRVQAYEIDPEIAKKGIARLVTKMNAIFGTKISKLELTFAKFGVKEAIFTFAPGIKARNPVAGDVKFTTTTGQDEKLFRQMSNFVKKFKENEKRQKQKVEDIANQP